MKQHVAYTDTPRNVKIRPLDCPDTFFQIASSHCLEVPRHIVPTSPALPPNFPCISLYLPLRFPRKFPAAFRETPRQLPGNAAASSRAARRASPRCPDALPRPLRETKPSFCEIYLRHRFRHTEKSGNFVPGKRKSRTKKTATPTVKTWQRKGQCTSATTADRRASSGWASAPPADDGTR